MNDVGWFARGHVMLNMNASVRISVERSVIPPKRYGVKTYFHVCDRFEIMLPIEFLDSPGNSHFLFLSDLEPDSSGT